MPEHLQVPEDWQEHDPDVLQEQSPMLITWYVVDFLFDDWMIFQDGEHNNHQGSQEQDEGLYKGGASPQQELRPISPLGVIIDVS